MWDISEEFVDYTRHRDKGSILLKSNKTIHPSFKDYPVEWTGLINNDRVKIVLNNSDASTLRNYDFLEFPEKHNDLKQQIADAIDEFIDEAMG